RTVDWRRRDRLRCNLSHLPRVAMPRGAKVLGLGIPALLIALFCLYEGCVVILADGSITVTATVHSEKHRQIRKVTYDHFGRREDAEVCLRYPREHAEVFREAWIKGNDSFSFDVPTSEHMSPFGLFRDQFYWRPFAVFRIECDVGEPAFDAAEIPNPRVTKA